MRLIEKEWQEYRSTALPEDLDPENLELVRGVFFCGAMAVFNATAMGHDRASVRAVKDELAAYCLRELANME